MSPKIRIAVTGSGGGVGQSVIKALSDTDYEVVALDGEPLGAGLYAASRSYVIPYANDHAFIEKVIGICQKENCSIIFPGLDAELSVFSANSSAFEAAGITVVVSSPDVIELSDDKLLTYTRLIEAGVSIPKTVDMANYHTNNFSLPDYPFIVKKRIGGARSQDVYLVKDEQQLNSLLDNGLKLADFIAQEYIEGDEYTCGSVNFGDECQGVIVMRRILRDGDTYKCFSVKDERIEAEVRKIMAAIQPFGGCNVQLRLKDGQPYVFEINARCSGTTGARALCGFNEPKMIADYICSGQKPSYTITEQTILRYWKELVVPNDLVDTLTQTGELQQSDFTKL